MSDTNDKALLEMFQKVLLAGMQATAEPTEDTETIESVAESQDTFDDNEDTSEKVINLPDFLHDDGESTSSDATDDSWGEPSDTAEDNFTSDDDFWGSSSEESSDEYFTEEPNESESSDEYHTEPTATSDEEPIILASDPNNTSIFENASDNMTPVTEPDDEPINYNAEVDKSVMQSLFDLLQRDFGGVKTTEEFNQELNEKYGAEAREKVFNNTQDFEYLNLEPQSCTFNGKTFTYQEYNAEITPDVDLDYSATPNMTMNYAKFCNFITDNIISLAGGISRISAIMVIDGDIIVNSVRYSPFIPESIINTLPIDTRSALHDGRFAQYFDFNTIRKMRILNELSFKDKSFIYNKVRFDLGFNRDFDIGDLFLVSKSLSYLEVGNKCYTRDTIKEAYDVNEYFRQHNKVYGFINWLHNSYVGVEGAKKSFKMAKDIWNSDGAFSKTRAVAMGVAGTATGILGGATWGISKLLEGGNYIAKRYGNTGVVKKAKDSVGSVFSALSDKY